MRPQKRDFRFIPLQSSSGVHVLSPGGDVHAYLQGASGFGY
jgi:hypothetical protein